MSNGSVAPNCPVSHNQLKITSRQQPPIVDLASVPTATDLPSAITALNQLNSIIHSITRGQPMINNIVFPSIKFTSTPPEREKPTYERVTWKEIIRDYHEAEVVNPDDEKQRVDIKTLARVIWEEATTEQRVVYKGRR